MDHSSYPKQRKEKYNKTYLNDSSLHNVSACTNMRYFELDRLLLILMILRMRELLSARLLSLNGKKKWWSVIWSELAWECKNETETAAENANMFNNILIINNVYKHFLWAKRVSHYHSLSLSLSLCLWCCVIFEF